MAATIMRLTDEALDRLSALAEATGSDVSTVVERLLDRDPHSHGHRCPTCVAIALREATGQVHHGQDVLFDAADSS